MNTIPPALIRPGRIDLKLHMGYIDNYQAELIFWKFFCIAENEKDLDDIPKKKYPLLHSTVNELIQRMRELAQQTSASTGIELEISPAELISYLLFHALKFKLSKNPEATKECCQSLLDNIGDFINSVSADRLQAIEHAKKKLSQQQKEQDNNTKNNSNNNDASTTTTNNNNHEHDNTHGSYKTITTTTTITKELIPPTPPTSPAAGKKTASEVDIHQDDDE
jgi:hypothetical protein